MAWTGETVLHLLEGAEVPVTLTLVTHAAGAGKPAYFSIMAREFSPGRRQQEDITFERDSFAGALDHVSELIVWKDRAGRHLRLNRAAPDRLGFAGPRGGVATTDCDVLPEEQVARFRALELEVFEQARDHASADMLAGCDAAASLRHVTVLPVRDAHGRVTGTMTISADAAQAGSATGSAALQQLRLEATADFLALVGADGRFRFSTGDSRRRWDSAPRSCTRLARWVSCRPRIALPCKPRCAMRSGSPCSAA
jgi:PAS domain-containing protein